LGAPADESIDCLLIERSDAIPPQGGPTRWVSVTVPVEVINVQAGHRAAQPGAHLAGESAVAQPLRSHDV